MLTIEDILVNQEKDLSQKELVALCEILRSHLYLKNYWMIDHLCRDINAEKASKIVLIGVLRYCFSYKDYLPHWRVLLGRCKQSLLNRGEDPERILNGLLNHL